VDFNGKKVTDPRSLTLLVAQTPPRTKVTLRVLRLESGGKPMERVVSAVLGELPREGASTRERAPSGEREQSSLDGLDGVEVADLDSRVHRRLDIPTGVRGALVTNVAEESNAAEAGLREGDVILEINRQPVRSAEEAIALSGNAKGSHILLRVWTRGANGGPGGTRYMAVNNVKHK